MLKASIHKIDNSQIIAHADMVVGNLETLKKEVSMKGFDVSPIEGMKSRSRIYEWLSIRLLLFEIFQKDCRILYSHTGKPSLEGIAANISISHSKDKIAIVVDFKKPTGVDIQKMSSKLKNIMHKFLHPNELARKDSYSTEELSVFWSAKEAIYKVHGHPEIFLRDILIEDFIFQTGGSTIKGSVGINGMSESFIIKYELVEDYILAYVVNP